MEMSWLGGYPQGNAKFFYEDGRPWMEIIYGDEADRVETRGFYPGSTPWFLFDSADVAGQDIRHKIPRIFSEGEFKRTGP